MMVNRLLKALAQESPKNLIGFSEEGSAWPQGAWLSFLTGQDGTKTWYGTQRPEGVLFLSPKSRCQFFDFGAVTSEAITDEALPVWEGYQEGLVRLPAQNCYMELTLPRNTEVGYPTHTTGFAFMDPAQDGDVVATAIITGKDVTADMPGIYEWDGVVLRMRQKFTHGTKQLQDGFIWEFNNKPVSVPISVEMNAHNRSQEYIQNASGKLFGCLMMMLGRLNADGVEREKVKPSEKLNTRRARRGLPEMVTHTTVKIRPYRPPLGRSGPREDDTYTTKRFHFRRGHVRRFQNGEKTWVRPCFVGTQESGTVEHDYVVEQA
jgi:hypothetical protein